MEGGKKSGSSSCSFSSELFGAKGSSANAQSSRTLASILAPSAAVLSLSLSGSVDIYVGLIKTRSIFLFFFFFLLSKDCCLGMIRSHHGSNCRKQRNRRNLQNKLSPPARPLFLQVCMYACVSTLHIHTNCSSVLDSLISFSFLLCWILYFSTKNTCFFYVK